MARIIGFSCTIGSPGRHKSSPLLCKFTFLPLPEYGVVLLLHRNTTLYKKRWRPDFRIVALLEKQHEKWKILDESPINQSLDDAIKWAGNFLLAFRSDFANESISVWGTHKLFCLELIYVLFFRTMLANPYFVERIDKVFHSKSAK